MAENDGTKALDSLAEKIDEQMNAAVYDLAHGDIPAAVRELTTMRSALDGAIDRLLSAGGAA